MSFVCFVTVVIRLFVLVEKQRVLSKTQGRISVTVSSERRQALRTTQKAEGREFVSTARHVELFQS